MWPSVGLIEGSSLVLAAVLFIAFFIGLSSGQKDLRIKIFLILFSVFLIKFKPGLSFEDFAFFSSGMLGILLQKYLIFKPYLSLIISIVASIILLHILLFLF